MTEEQTREGDGEERKKCNEGADGERERELDVVRGSANVLQIQKRGEEIGGEESANLA